MKKNIGTRIFLSVVFAIVIVVFVSIISYNKCSVKTLTMSEFIAKTGYNVETEVFEENNAEIKKIVVNSYNLNGYVKNSNGKYVLKYKTSCLRDDNVFSDKLIEELGKHGCIIDVKDLNANS